MADKRVIVRDNTGQLGTVPESQLNDVIESGGELATSKELQRAKLVQEYGGAGGTAAAIAAGAGRGLTFGLSDAALVGAGGEQMREALANLEAINPYASIGGEVAGALLPALIPGGQAAEAGALARAGRLATALPRGVSALGGLAERGVVRALGEGTTFGGRLLRGMAKTAAGAATEGMFYGAGAELSDSFIHDKELTAEKLLAGAGKGALLGLVFGGATGALTGIPGAMRGAVSAEAKAAQAIEHGAVTAERRTVADVLEGRIGAETKAETEAASRASEAGKAHGKTVSETVHTWADESVEDYFKRVTGQVEKEAGVAGKEAVDAVKSSLDPWADLKKAAGYKEGQSIADYLMSKRNEKAYQSLGGNTRHARKVNTWGGGTEEMGKILYEEAPGFAGVKDFRNMSNEAFDIAQRNGRKHYGGEIVNRLGEATAKGAGIEAGATVGILDNLIAKYETTIGGASAANALKTERGTLLKMLGAVDEKGELIQGALSKRLSMEEAHQLRSAFDKAAFKTDPITLKPTQDALFQVRDALEKEIIADGVRVGGPKWAQDYARAKKGYQVFTMAKQAIEEAAAKGASLRTMGLSEQLGGGFGSMVGSLFGGPVGTVIGHGVGSAAAYVTRKRGDFIAADLFDKLARINGIERVAAAVDNKIDDGVNAFLKGKPSVKSKTTSESVSSWSKEEAESFVKRASRTYGAVRRAQGLHQTENQMRTEAARVFGGYRNNPTAQMTAAQRVIGDQLGALAPGLSSTAAVKVASMINLAALNAPAMKGQPNFGQHKSYAEPDKAAVLKLSQFFEGLHSPLSILEDMAEGKLSHAKAMAVREGYPKVWEQITSKVRDKVASGESGLNYNQRIQASILFGEPLDRSMQPDMVKTIQEAKTAQQPQNEPAPAPPTGGKVDIEKGLDTESAQIEKGID